MYFFLLKREKQPLGVHDSVKMFQYLPLLSCGKTDTWWDLKLCKNSFTNVLTSLRILAQQWRSPTSSLSRMIRHQSWRYFEKRVASSVVVREVGNCC